MDKELWLEMCEVLKEHGYNEGQIAHFNRLTIKEFRTLMASIKIKKGANNA